MVGAKDRETLRGFVDGVAEEDAEVLHGRLKHKGCPNHEAVAHNAREYVRCLKSVEDPYERRGVVLEHAEAGTQGNLPQALPEAPPAVRQRVRRTAQ